MGLGTGFRIMLWVEKYRPKSFDDIAGNDEKVRQIQSEVESGNMNHMFFYGPPGTGKTTTATVIARELYDSVDSSQFMELNASDERGISTIRDKVKSFAGRKTLVGDFKLVFLDEGDSLTPDAQQALRRVMEQYQESCRFIITGNNEGGVIDALKSRCSDYKFEPIADDSAKERLLEIVDKEDVDIDEEIIGQLVTIYSGDLRSMIGKLQGIAGVDDVSLETGEDYMKLLKFVSEKNFSAATKIASEENLKQLHGYLMTNNNVPDRVKAETSIAYAKYMWRMNRSPDKQIQVNALVAELIKKVSEHIQ